MSGFFMHRFFADFPLQESLSLRKEQPLFHQIGHVFRAKIWHEVIFFEDNGPDCVYKIIDVSAKNISFQRIEIWKNLWGREWPHICLFQAYPHKMSALELIVQKIVEMGVHELVLFPGEYSQVQLLPASKMQRLLAIAREAMEQSGGNALLRISEKNNIAECFPIHSEMYHIIAHPGAQQALALPEKIENSLGLWVGPEGWWSPKEQDIFHDKSLPFWSFSNRILRLETASILWVGILGYLCRSK